MPLHVWPPIGRSGSSARVAPRIGPDGRTRSAHLPSPGGLFLFARRFCRGRDLCRGFRAVHPRVFWTALRSMYIAGLQSKQPTPRDRNGIQQTTQHPGHTVLLRFFFRSRIGGAKLSEFSLSLSSIFCMIVASSSSSLCLPANLVRGRVTMLIYVAQHFL